MDVLLDTPGRMIDGPVIILSQQVMLRQPAGFVSKEEGMFPIDASSIYQSDLAESIPPLCSPSSLPYGCSPNLDSSFFEDVNSNKRKLIKAIKHLITRILQVTGRERKKNVIADDLFGPVRKELQGHRVMTHAALHGCFLCLLCFLWPIFRCSFFTLRLTLQHCIQRSLFSHLKTQRSMALSVSSPAKAH